MLIPVHIKPYLVPFFFKEMEGKEARYLNKKVKSVNIANVSSFGSIVRMLLVRTELPSKFDKLSFFLQISESVKKEYKGSVYKVCSGKTSFLKVPEEVNNMLNDLLEDYFRLCFVYYLEGYKKSNDKAKIRPAIEDFMEDYELYEFGFTCQSLRTMYYREQRKNRKLSRIQYKTSPRAGSFLM
jgi:hypothetical protein